MVPTAATTTRSPERLLRFDRGERWLHWVNAALFAVCMLTAAMLYLSPLSTLVGRRNLVRDVHVVAGLALPLPFLALLGGRWGAGFRRDVARLNRFSADDRRWLRSLGRDPFVRLGKFNPGQKLNAAFTAGSIILMVASGYVMRWFGPFPLAWRTGSTFVHDWTAFVLLLTITGHIAKAVSDREALRAMVRGTVSRGWARRRAPRWYAEVADDPPTP